MNARRHPFAAIVALAALLLTVACSTPEDVADLATAGRPLPRAVGDVEIVFPGSGGPAGAGDRTAFAAVTWFDGTPAESDRGEFRYTVVKPDGTVAREIVAVVTDDPDTGVVVAYLEGRAWFVGEVVSDQRSDGHGTHEGGGETPPDSAHDDGTHEDGTHDDGTHDDGTHEDGDHGGGCAGGHDDGDGHDGGTGSPPGSGSRVGQRVAVRLVDGGTPAAGNDEIAWRWFYADVAPAITPLTDWPDTCPKTILAGNFAVLAVPGPARR